METHGHDTRHDDLHDDGTNGTHDDPGPAANGRSGHQEACPA